MRPPLAAVAVSLLLAACASAPPAEPKGRADLGDFALEARFALSTERPQEPPVTASGRLSWSHSGPGDRILVSTPLGQGIAEIETSTAGATLRQSDGTVRRAADAGALLREATGYTLPLGELPAWLLGRAGPDGQLVSDARGRPQRLTDGGWRIVYDYDNDDPDALPARVTVSRQNDLELRLRIEEWRSLP